jgi:DNA-binding NtrC family response regulator
MPRILIVDDDRATRQLTAEVLREAGHTVSEASTAREALARCKANRPDLVLLDLILPDRTGVDLLGELKALWPELQVVFLTAYPEVRSAVEAMRRGAAEYLPKPVDPETLVAICDAALAAPARPGSSGTARAPAAQEIATPAWAPAGSPRPLREVVTAYIEHVVSVTHGNKARAARLLGISRETLRGKLNSRIESESDKGLSGVRGAS